MSLNHQPILNNRIEVLHRSVISELNKERNGFDIIYYNEVNIEKNIAPLVKLLNNEWTLTTHSCGGHWSPKSRFQYPYISFNVFANRATWRKIVQYTWKSLIMSQGGVLTIMVSDHYKLPDILPSSSLWGFYPKINGANAWRYSRNIFGSEKIFNQQINMLLKEVCLILKTQIESVRHSQRKGKR